LSNCQESSKFASAIVDVDPITKEVQMSIIKQLPTTGKTEINELETHRTSGLIYACDFYITDSEKGESVPGGYQTDWLVCVDHHAATDRMRKKISSTTLAIEHVRAFGPVRSPDVVLINHTDCDSILSSRIMAGDLEPLDIYNAAAIAADHTGEENEIADLLQALDDFKDHDFSFRCLQMFLDGERLNFDKAAKNALDIRLMKRSIARDIVSGNKFIEIGCLSYAVLKERIDGELFQPLLKQSYVNMAASPRVGEFDVWDIKIRLGESAPEELTLKDIDLSDFDPKYSGRWNAGSNKRGGGTKLTPDVYAEKLLQAINTQLLQLGL
jgi:hypothetical protein